MHTRTHTRRPALLPSGASSYLRTSDQIPLPDSDANPWLIPWWKGLVGSRDSLVKCIEHEQSSPEHAGVSHCPHLASSAVSCVHYTLGDVGVYTS